MTKATQKQMRHQDIYIYIYTYTYTHTVPVSVSVPVPVPVSVSKILEVYNNAVCLSVCQLSSALRLRLRL